MSEKNQNTNFYIGELLVSPQHNEISLSQRVLKLQPKVMAVLHYLARHQERVISNEELIDEVWDGRVVTHASVQKSMNSLRSALAELAGEQEFVAHYSKRGYQLIVPARFQNTELKAVRAGSKKALIPAALVLLVIFVAFFWMSTAPQAPTISINKNHLSHFHSALGFTNERGHERSPEPNPDGKRVAYVRDTAVAGETQSQILIRDETGQDWPLASAQGSWVSLAWSPSGRNLLALEIWRPEGLPSPAYYEKPNYLYTFHIFTLDFSGKRLLEKNLLSQWQGAIGSITWWDESTIEFVGSQGPNSTNERYRYAIAEQKLSALNALDSGYIPLLSANRDKVSAVLSRRRNLVQLEFLDEEQKRISAWEIESGNVDVSWIPDGSGVLILEKSSGRLYALYLNGEISPIKLDQHTLSFAQPRFRPDGKSILTAVSTEQVGVNVAGLDSTLQTLSIGAYLPNTPVFSPDGSALVYASFRNSQYQLWRMENEREEQLVATEASIGKILWPDQGDFVLYSSAGVIWQYNLNELRQRALLDPAGRSEALDYDPLTKFLWFLKVNADTRNIWRRHTETQEDKQFTFGSVGSALGFRGKIYFQYAGQDGLWVLHEESGHLEQIGASLHKNSQLLRANESGVFFVSGGPCRESGLQFLDFSKGMIATVLERKNQALITYDFHPLRGVLQVECALSESNIVELK